MDIVDRLNAQFSHDFNAGDLESLIDFYAEDAITFPPDREAVRGRGAHRKYFEEGLKRQAKRALSFTSIHSEFSGDLLTDSGQWTQPVVTPEGKTVLTTGYYMTTYKKVVGEWKAVMTTFNFLPLK